MQLEADASLTFFMLLLWLWLCLLVIGTTTTSSKGLDTNLVIRVIWEGIMIAVMMAAGISWCLSEVSLMSRVLDVPPSLVFVFTGLIVKRPCPWPFWFASLLLEFDVCILWLCGLNRVLLLSMSILESYLWAIQWLIVYCLSSTYLSISCRHTCFNHTFCFNQGTNSRVASII